MHSDKHLIEVKSLEVLQAMLPVNQSRTKKKVTLGMEEKDTSELVSTKQSNGELSFLLCPDIELLISLHVDPLFTRRKGLRNNEQELATVSSRFLELNLCSFC